MTCPICGKELVKDLTQGLGNDRHYYCTGCRAHNYMGQWWTRKEWDKWINDGGVQALEEQADAILKNAGRGKWGE